MSIYRCLLIGHPKRFKLKALKEPISRYVSEVTMLSLISLGKCYRYYCPSSPKFTVL